MRSSGARDGAYEHQRSQTAQSTAINGNQWQSTAINGKQQQSTAINCNQRQSKATHLVDDRQFRTRVRRALEADDAQPDDPRRARRSARRPGHARRARARVRRRRSTRLAPRVGGCARAAHRTRTPPGRVHVSQVRQELPKQQQQVPSEFRSERHEWHQCREHATTGLSWQAGQAACPVKQLGPVRVDCACGAHADEAIAPSSPHQSLPHQSRRCAGVASS